MNKITMGECFYKIKLAGLVYFGAESVKKDA